MAKVNKVKLINNMKAIRDDSQYSMKFQRLQYENKRIFACAYYVYVNEETDFGFPEEGKSNPKMFADMLDEYEAINVLACEIDKAKLKEHVKKYGRRSNFKDHPYIIQVNDTRICLNHFYLTDLIKLTESNRLFVDKRNFGGYAYKYPCRLYSDDWKQTALLLPVNPLYKMMEQEPNQIEERKELK